LNCDHFIDFKPFIQRQSFSRWPHFGFRWFFCQLCEEFFPSCKNDSFLCAIHGIQNGLNADETNWATVSWKKRNIHRNKEIKLSVTRWTRNRRNE
jgi:hypothetical protein